MKRIDNEPGRRAYAAREKDSFGFSLVDLKSPLGVPIEDNSSKSVYVRGAVIDILGSLKETGVVGILGSENFSIDRNVVRVHIEERRRKFGRLGDIRSDRLRFP